ncbi:hypothetical protein LMH87_002768 [Akanthomyces muscarius]|uniref:Uncharacterized protein n=1 Tax=Akanthomyces muscarius TaxID=2231603 RepID=A0A9W8Q7E4_AKAMU|nr:hypothetical protein LMH87_002768 [Akanthomyces muscarius]KAJ4148289.1 hypothetical protein LMH87_002768 [Akanthomyces muscarius]
MSRFACPLNAQHKALSNYAKLPGDVAPCLSNKFCCHSTISSKRSKRPGSTHQPLITLPLKHTSSSLGLSRRRWYLAVVCLVTSVTNEMSHPSEENIGRFLQRLPDLGEDWGRLPVWGCCDINLQELVYAYVEERSRSWPELQMGNPISLGLGDL